MHRASSENGKHRFQSFLLVVSRCWLRRTGPWSRRGDERPQQLCCFHKFECEWELDVSVLPPPPPTAAYTTVRPTNERAATPQTFLMTFIPPHFPSTETHTHLTWPHPDDYHSPQHGPSSLPSPHLHHRPQSVISCQAPSGPRLFSASCSIRMQQAINAISAWGRPGATGDPEPQYLWCHQIKGGQGAIIMTPAPFVLYSIIFFAFEIYVVFICSNPSPSSLFERRGRGWGQRLWNVL